MDRGTGPARAAAEVAFRLPAAWVWCAHFPMVPCPCRGASAGDALQESGGNAAARGQLDFAMAAIGNLYPAPQAATGLPAPPDRVPPSPFLPVSEPGPAWIMPVAGTFMRRRHAARPEHMGSPRIARPQPGGESGRIRAAFRRIARRRMPSAPPRGLHLAEAPVQDPQSMPGKACPETLYRAPGNAPPASA